MGHPVKQSLRRIGYPVPGQADVGLDGAAAHDVWREGLGEEPAEEENGRHQAQPAGAAAATGQRAPHRRSHFSLRSEI